MAILHIECPKCGAPIHVYNLEKSHSLICKQCGTPLYWDASFKDIDADIKRAELKHEEKMAKYKKQLEQQRHNNRIELELLQEEHKLKNKNTKTNNELKEIIVLVFLILIIFVFMFIVSKVK